jgi:YD repeat-containing protein
MWDVCGRSGWTYDEAGRVTREERTIDGRPYATQWTHDALDRVHQLTYPDGEVLTHEYSSGTPDGSLHLSDISTSQPPGGTDFKLVTQVGYNVLRQPKAWLMGSVSGVAGGAKQQFYGLDGVAQGTAPFGAVQKLELRQGTSAHLVLREMNYDKAGNVTWLHDGTAGETFEYAYDERDRLRAMGGSLTASYAYDKTGNLTAKNSAPLTYPAGGQARPHAVTGFAGTTYGYDANGSLVSRVGAPPAGSWAFRYDPERRPVRATKDGVTVWRAAYDGDGARRKRLDQLRTMYYAGPHYERNAGNGAAAGQEVVTKAYRAFGRLIALRKGASSSGWGRTTWGRRCGWRTRRGRRWTGSATRRSARGGTRRWS